MYRFLPSNQQKIQFLLDGKEETHRIYKRFIDKAQDELESQNFEPKEQTNILELFLLERHNRKFDESDAIFDDAQLKHLLADLFGAGVDTTLTSIRWILLYISMNPSIRQKIKMVILNTLFIFFI